MTLHQRLKRRSTKRLRADLVAVNFAPNQALPPGYRVEWREQHEAYQWARGTEADHDYGDQHGCRFAARREAWRHYNATTSL